MRYENKISRMGFEFGGAGGGLIESVGRQPAPSMKSGETVSNGDVVVGVAATYGTLHRGTKGDWEAFVPGCFGRTLATKQAVRLLIGHDETKLIATRADALSIESDDQKLSFRCEIPDGPMGRALKSAMLAEKFAECSVGYQLVESYVREIGGRQVKLITDAQLLEISIVASGAVPGTNAEYRQAEDRGSLLGSLQQLADVLEEKNRAMRLLLGSL